MRYPLGQGMNVQISVQSIEPIEAGLSRAGVTPYEPAADVWYHIGPQRVGQRELLVQDPTGFCCASLPRSRAEILITDGGRAIGKITGNKE